MKSMKTMINTKNHIVLSPYTIRQMRGNGKFDKNGDMFTCCTKTGRHYVSFRYFEPGASSSIHFYFYTPPRTGPELVRQVRNAFISGLRKGIFKDKQDLDKFAAKMEKEMRKYKTKAPYYTRNQQPATEAK